MSEAAIKQSGAAAKATIVIAAGGTGGHIMPALVVARELRKRGYQIKWVGIGRDIERALLEGSEFDYQVVSFLPVKGGGLLGLLKMLGRLPAALAEAKSLLTHCNAAIVIGFGGYPSFPAMLAARQLGLPRILHEQNAEVGLANKFLSLFASKIYCAHGARGFWRSKTVVEIGNPVRQRFYELQPWQPPELGQTFRLLIVGGSQGATAVNTAVLSTLELLKRFHVEVCHQAGRADAERVRAAYAGQGMDSARVEEFIEDIAAEYEKAHLVISRAGAMSVAEVSAAARPCIFIPLPIAGGHQRENARYLLERKACWLLEQDEHLASRLRELLGEALERTELLAEKVALLEDISGSEQARPEVKIAEACQALIESKE